LLQPAKPAIEGEPDATGVINIILVLLEAGGNKIIPHTRSFHKWIGKVATLHSLGQMPR